MGVLEENDGFMSGVESEFAVRGRVDIGEGELGPRDIGGRIEHAETEASFEKTFHGAIDIFDGQEAVAHGVVKNIEFRAAGEVGASLHGESGGLVERKDKIVALVEIGNGPAVGNNVTLEAPLIAEEVEEEMIGAGRLAEHGVVGAHNGISVSIDDGGAKGWRVGVIEIVERHGNVEAVAESFGAGVDGVVFGRGDGLEIARVISLESSDESSAETAGEERVFAVSFLAASPARIAKDVDVGGPEGEAEVARGVVVELRVVIFGAGLGGNDVGDAMEEAGVPGGGETDGLRKNGGDTGASDAMESFIPPVVSGYLQARDGGGDVLQLGDFFFEGKAGNEVVDAGVDGEGGIEVGGSGLWREGSGLGRGQDGEKKKR